MNLLEGFAVRLAFVCHVVCSAACLPVYLSVMVCLFCSFLCLGVAYPSTDVARRRPVDLDARESERDSEEPVSYVPFGSLQTTKSFFLSAFLRDDQTVIH